MDGCATILFHRKNRRLIGKRIPLKKVLGCVHRQDSIVTGSINSLNLHDSTDITEFYEVKYSSTNYQKVISFLICFWYHLIPALELS